MKFLCKTITADVPNANGNIYSRECLDTVVKDFRKSSKMIPLYASINDAQHAASNGNNPERMAGYVTEMNIKDNQLIVKCSLAQTNMGDIVKALSGAIKLGDLAIAPLMIGNMYKDLDPTNDTNEIDPNGLILISCALMPLDDPRVRKLYYKKTTVIEDAHKKVQPKSKKKSKKK